MKRPPSLSEHVCQVIRDDILSGRLKSGDRLTEAQVMERTAVSRTPVREGLRRLEAEGLVISHRGRGTFITYRLSPEEAMLMYRSRLIFEPYLTRLAAERSTDAELSLIEESMERFAAVDDADPYRAGQLDADFHLAIYEASRSELMSVLRGYWSRLQVELSERVYATEVPRYFADEHVAVFKAIANGDGELAAEEMHRHIEHGREAIDKALSGQDSRSDRAE